MSPWRQTLTLLGVIVGVIAMLVASYIFSNRNFDALEEQNAGLRQFAIRSDCLDDAQARINAALAAYLRDVTIDRRNLTPAKIAEVLTQAKRDAAAANRAAADQLECPPSA